MGLLKKDPHGRGGRGRGELGSYELRSELEVELGSYDLGLLRCDLGLLGCDLGLLSCDLGLLGCDLGLLSCDQRLLSCVG